MADEGFGSSVLLPPHSVRIEGMRWNDQLPTLTLSPFAAVVFADSDDPEGDLIQLNADLFLPARSDGPLSGRSGDEMSVFQFVKWRDELARILTPGAKFEVGSLVGGVSVEFQNVRGDVLVKGTVAETGSEWTKEPDEKLHRRLTRTDHQPLSRLDFCFILDPAAVAPMQHDLAALLEHAAAARRACVN